MGFFVLLVGKLGNLLGNVPNLLTVSTEAFGGRMKLFR